MELLFVKENIYVELSFKIDNKVLRLTIQIIRAALTTFSSLT